jgi:hypothetical protein
MTKIVNRPRSLFPSPWHWRLFLLLVIIGAVASLWVGLSWDQGLEMHTVRMNRDALVGLLTGSLKGYRELMSYGDRYYGIGFTLPEYLLQHVFYPPLAWIFHVNKDTAMKIGGNLAVFLAFAASTVLVMQILRRLTDNHRYAYWGAIAWLLWPYMLGHGWMNMKDIPFAIVWLLCFYQMHCLTQKLLGEEAVAKKDFAWFGVCVAWLIAIRISGVLFFFAIACQVFLLAATVLFQRRTTAAQSATAAIHRLTLLQWLNLSGVFVSSCLLAIIALYPIAWHNPLELVNAVRYMSHHFWPGATLTNGQHMPSQNLPVAHYLYEWLKVKLPLVTLLGLVTLPIALWRVRNTIADARRVTWIALFATAILLIPILSLKQVALYDELRQVLFIPAMLFIGGWVALYHVNLRVARVALFATLVLFAADNVRIYPYQYTWFNELTRRMDIDKFYETDYWGTSLRHLAKTVNKVPDLPQLSCVVADPVHLMAPFVAPHVSSCVKAASDFHAELGRPFLKAGYTRGGNFQISPGCREVAVEQYTPLFSPYPITLAISQLCEK